MRRGHRARARFEIDRRSRAAFVVVVALLVVVFAGGGASRTDVYSLLYVRPLAASALFGLLLLVHRRDVEQLRPLVALLLGLAAVIAIQLLPLPASLWLALPGHGRFAEAAEVAGIAQPWRPLTLTPDLAWSSLLAVVPPLAALLAVAILGDEDRARLLPVLLGGITASILFGLMQVTGGPTSPAFTFNITHEGSAVGLFANRNHQAALLAATFPLLRAWTLAPSSSRDHALLRRWVAVAFAVVLVPMIAVTGSRAGLALAAVGIIGAWFVRPPLALTQTIRRPVLAISIGLVAICGLATAVIFGRATAIDRLLDPRVIENEPRFQNTGTVLEIIRDFFPFGSGFGSFDRIFRVYEPDSSLSPFYFNRAHNDLLELALTGGLPAIALLAVFLFWWGRAGIRLFVRSRRLGSEVYRARAAWLVILIVLLASLMDYPLRTPLMAVVFAIAAAFVAVQQAVHNLTSGAAAVAQPPDPIE